MDEIREVAGCQTVPVSAAVYGRIKVATSRVSAAVYGRIRVAESLVSAAVYGRRGHK